MLMLHNLNVFVTVPQLDAK